MAGLFQIRIRLSATQDQIRQVFAALEKGLKDLTPTLTEVKGILARMFVDTFETRGAALGETWSEVTDLYARKKAQLGDGPPLSLTGRLLASLSDPSRAGSDSIRSIRRRGDDLPKLVYGTRVPYATPLNFGSRAGRLVPRTFVGVSDEAREDTTRLFQEYLQSKLDAAARDLTDAGGP